MSMITQCPKLVYPICLDCVRCCYEPICYVSRASCQNTGSCDHRFCEMNNGLSELALLETEFSYSEDED